MIRSSLEVLAMPDPLITATSPQGSTPEDGGRRLPDAVDIGPAEQDRLLALARAAVSVAAGALPAGSLEAELNREPLPDRRAAAFVTLEEHGELRGCMGAMDPETPAWASVVQAARWAARDDPRFPPLDPRDLPAIEIEISILGPLVLLEDPLSWRLGIDGVVVRRSGRRGLLLPEVAGMRGMDRTTMLDTCCRKAGLPAGAWRQAGSEVLAFRTRRFGGAALIGAARTGPAG
jgi:AmmeMemoRadiSam system protein A